jgi:hypothetical protein
MNAPGSEELTYPEDAPKVPGGPYARFAVEMARHVPLNLVTARSGRLPQRGHARLDFGLEFDSPLQGGVPVISTDRIKPRKIHPWHSASDRCSARSGHPKESRFDGWGPSLDRIAQDSFELVSTNNQRITRQAGTGWGDRPTHEHLAVTERNWRFSPSDRHLRESAATTTVGTALPGNSSAVEDS